MGMAPCGRSLMKKPGGSGWLRRKGLRMHGMECLPLRLSMTMAMMPNANRKMTSRGIITAAIGALCLPGLGLVVPLLVVVCGSTVLVEVGLGLRDGLGGRVLRS